MISAGIIGGTGYTGAELMRLLAGHDIERDPAAEILYQVKTAHLRGCVVLKA